MNLALMRKKFEGDDRIELVPYGMWFEKGKIGFANSGATGSKIDVQAAETITVDTIDNVCAAEKVTFIKMDIEGAEQSALQGAVNIIKRDKPRLAICIYHSLEDLYAIPFWIKAMVPEYKLYLRHHSDNAAETVIYAML